MGCTFFGKRFTKSFDSYNGYLAVRMSLFAVSLRRTLTITVLHRLPSGRVPRKLLGVEGCEAIASLI